jgi:hypothetical protein
MSALTLGLAASVLVATNALAHLPMSPRVLQLRFLPNRVEVAVGETIHPGPEALLVRERFDADRDAVLSEAEQSELATWMNQRARRNMELRLDGILLQPELGELAVSLEPGEHIEEGDSIRLRSVAAVALMLRPGRHELSLKAAPASPRLVLPLRIDLLPGWAVVDQLMEGDLSQLLPDATGLKWSGGWTGRGGTLTLAVQVEQPRAPAAGGPATMPAAESTSR